MHAPHVRGEVEAVEYGWRRRVVAWSVPVAIACGAVAVALLAAGDGLVVWRLVGAVVLIVVAFDSVRFVVQAQRHAAIRFDRFGITVFGILHIPWTATRSCRVVSGDEGDMLVLELAEDAQGVDRARSLSPRMRRYRNRFWRDRRLELDVSVLEVSPSQLAGAIERFAASIATTAQRD